MITQLPTHAVRYEQDVEPQGERDDEDEEDHDEPEEGLEDVEEHDDVDAEEGKLTDVTQQIKPGQHDHQGAHLPLPALEEKLFFGNLVFYNSD